VLPKLLAAEFKNKTRDRRLLLYAEFLDNLKAWQAQVMMQQFHRFPFMSSWRGRLADAIQTYREQRSKNS
jgi:hypothetical protein